MKAPRRFSLKPGTPPFWHLRITAAVMLLGHATMAWMGQIPLRALLWDEKLVAETIQKWAEIEWAEWVSSMQIDARIENVIFAQGCAFCAFALLIILPTPRILLAPAAAAASLNLVFLASLKHHNSGMGIGHFFEHASQFSIPLLITLFVIAKPWAPLAKCALAATFICHGASAIGLESQIPMWNHPRPGNYMEMTMQCLGLQSESIAAGILVAAGILDILVATSIFLSGWPQRLGLTYMAGWGFLTALARPWFHFEPTAAAETLLRWLPEFFFRAPHFCLPLCLLLALSKRRVKTPAPK